MSKGSSISTWQKSIEAQYDDLLIYYRSDREHPSWFSRRETYTIFGPDEFEELFELAEPGKNFELYSRARFTRVP